MMIGNNTMYINEATMKLIVQEWLERQLTGQAPKVTGIAYHGVRDRFEIDTEGPFSDQP